jgi:hypothetical protein
VVAVISKWSPFCGSVHVISYRKPSPAQPKTYLTYQPPYNLFGPTPSQTTSISTKKSLKVSSPDGVLLLQTPGVKRKNVSIIQVNADDPDEGITPSFIIPSSTIPAHVNSPAHFLDASENRTVNGCCDNSSHHASVQVYVSTPDSVCTNGVTQHNDFLLLGCFKARNIYFLLHFIPFVIVAYYTLCDFMLLLSVVYVFSFDVPFKTQIFIYLLAWCYVTR